MYCKCSLTTFPCPPSWAHHRNPQLHLSLLLFYTLGPLLHPGFSPPPAWFSPTSKPELSPRKAVRRPSRSLAASDPPWAVLPTSRGI